MTFEALARLRGVPQTSEELCVTPTFARSLLLPRLRQFTEAYPEIDLTLQVSIPLLEHGSLVHLGTSAAFTHTVPSPHAHYLCWRTGMMDRWECAAFADWLKKSVA